MTTTRPSTPDLPPVPGKRYFTLSEMCALTGVAPELLRQWEATGMSFGRQPGSRPRQHYQHHEVLMVRRLRNALLAQRAAQARQTAESRSRLGAPALRAELASILAWLDI